MTFPLACPPGSTAQDQQEFIDTVLSVERFAAYLEDPDRDVLVADDLSGYTMLVAGEPTDEDVRAALHLRPTIELSASAKALRFFRSRTERVKPRPEIATDGQGGRPQPQPGHRRGRNLPEQPVRQPGPVLDRHDPDDDHGGGQHELSPVRSRPDIPEMNYPRLEFPRRWSFRGWGFPGLSIPGGVVYSHLKVRAARAIATTAQTAA